MDISLEAIEQQLTIAAAYEGTVRATQALARAQILATLYTTADPAVIGQAVPVIHTAHLPVLPVEVVPEEEREEDFFAEVRKTHKK